MRTDMAHWLLIAVAAGVVGLAAGPSHAGGVPTLVAQTTTPSVVARLADAKRLLLSGDYGTADGEFAKVLGAATSARERGEISYVWARTLVRSARLRKGHEPSLERALVLYQFATNPIFTESARRQFVVLNNYGSLLLQMGRADEALKILGRIDARAARRLDRRSRARYHFLLGEARRSKGQLGEASSEYRAAARLDPAFKPAARAALRVPLSRPPDASVLSETAKWMTELLDRGDTRIVQPFLRRILTDRGWTAHRSYPPIFMVLIEYLTKVKVGKVQFTREWDPILRKFNKDPDARHAGIIGEIRSVYRRNFKVIFSRSESRSMFPNLLRRAGDRDRATSVLSDFLRMVGDDILETKNRNTSQTRLALQRYGLAWSIHPKNMEAGLYAVNILLEASSQVDPRGNLLGRVVNELFNEKAEAYRVGDALNKMRLHVLLGTIFERRASDGSTSILRSPEYHWSRAIDNYGRLTPSQRRFVPGIPGLYASLAKTYERTNQISKAQHQYNLAANEARRINRTALARGYAANAIRVAGRTGPRGGGGGGGAGGGGGGGSNSIELRLASYLDPKSPINALVLSPWIKDVQSRADGKLKIKTFWGGQLERNPARQYPLVLKNVAHIALIPASAHRKQFPQATVLELPNLIRTALEGSVAGWRLHEKGLLRGLDGVETVGILCDVPLSLHSKKTVKSLNDLKGMKFRVFGEYPTIFLKRFGAIAVRISGSKVYASLERGIVDGIAMPIGRIDRKLQRVVTSHYRIPLGCSPFILAMNKRIRDKLPGRIKQIMDKRGGLTLARLGGGVFDEIATRNLERLRKTRNQTIVEPSAADRKRVQGVAREIQDQWKKKIKDGRRTFAALIEMLAQIRKSR